jgi:hypothetical protein
MSVDSSIVNFGVVGESLFVVGGVDKLVLALSTSPIVLKDVGFDLIGDGGGGGGCDVEVGFFLGVTSSPGRVAII